MAKAGDHPFCEHQEAPDLSNMELESFKSWSLEAPKAFLQVRKRSVEGSMEELVARSFIAWADKASVDPDEEYSLRCNLLDYNKRLTHEQFVILDLFSLQQGWSNEDLKVHWPRIYFVDIYDYLRIKTPIELYHRLCNEYKQGKSYRYFTSGWAKQVYYHPIDSSSKVYILAAKISPSMRLRASIYEAWVAVFKDGNGGQGGSIALAYCTCTAGWIQLKGMHHLFSRPKAEPTKI